MIIEFMKKIEKMGYDIYLVGGYPRDTYLGISSNDMDLCTNADYEAISKIVNISKSQFLSFHIEYKGTSFEVTQFRKEEDYTNHGYPSSVTPINDLKTDLLRRDFTINTLAMNSNGEYIDLLGARKDIDKKVIKTVGDPNKKITQDASRILRALRFKVDLDFNLDKDLEKAIIDNKKLLLLLSKSKIEKEINLIKNKDIAHDLFEYYDVISILNEKKIILN